jgi:hypothetical protein
VANTRADNSLIGAAGVHYVAYQFLKRGMLALPTVQGLHIARARLAAND